MFQFVRTPMIMLVIIKQGRENNMYMYAKDLIAQIEETEGLDMKYINDICSRKGNTVRGYIIEYLMEYYKCSEYVAKKVAEHYINVNATS